jgi:dihydroneopterin aldolase
MPPTRSRSPETPHLVAKIGGSLWTRPDALRSWLAALARYPGPLTIAPGGGPFADAVRAAQATLRFSDAAAHEMAIMGMEQYALALADLAPGLVPVSSPQEAALAHRRGAAALWRPVAMTRAAPHIRASWDVTSDSLSAWYAREAGADALLLVKSVGIQPLPDGEERQKAASRSMRDRAAPTPPSSFEQDVGSVDGDAAQIVDRCFALYARGLAVFIAGPADLRDAGETASRGKVPGAPFEFLTREQSIAS